MIPNPDCSDFCGTERSGIAPKDATQEEVDARQLETNNIVQE
jgi:hypothetical protein